MGENVSDTPAAGGVSTWQRTLDNSMHWKIKPAEAANSDWRNEFLMTSAELVIGQVIHLIGTPNVEQSYTNLKTLDRRVPTPLREAQIFPSFLDSEFCMTDFPIFFKFIRFCINFFDRLTWNIDCNYLYRSLISLFVP